MRYINYEYFAHDEGFLIKVDPKRIRVVTSPLTGETFTEFNHMSNRKEMEFIVNVAEGYKFEMKDFEICSEDYLIAAESPLAVAFFGHDDKKAEYDLFVPEKNTTYQITAQFYWNSAGNNGKIQYSVYKDGAHISYSEGPMYIKKNYGFDPTPKEDNLQYISNYRISSTRR